jgi:hypothetical protein
VPWCPAPLCRPACGRGDGANRGTTRRRST